MLLLEAGAAAALTMVVMLRAVGGSKDSTAGKGACWGAAAGADVAVPVLVEGEKVTREVLKPPTGEPTLLLLLALLLLLEGAPGAPKSLLLLEAKGTKGDEGMP